MDEKVWKVIHCIIAQRGLEIPAGMFNRLRGLEVPDGMYDGLYREALSNAFDGRHGDSDVLQSCLLRLLHTIACANPPISLRVASDLAHTAPTVAEELVRRLPHVLYVDDTQSARFLHHSFTEFLFDRSLSGNYWCNQASRHYRLARDCLHVMNSTLRFNMAGFNSSFLLDDLCEPDFRQNIEDCISTTLAYACRSWSTHVGAGKVSLRMDSDVLEGLRTFLSLPALFWIEAMNLLGLSGDCTLMAERARDIVSQVRRRVSVEK